MHHEKIKNILSLSSEDRYGYFIRKVADFEEVWIIKDQNSFVTLGDKDEQVSIPVFPEQQFAELFLTDSWSSYSVENMNLTDFMNWLDTLQEDSIAIAGFPNTDFNSVIVTAEEMKNHLLYEIDQYE